MSATPVSMTELLKSAQTATSASGLSMLLSNSSGELAKMDANAFLQVQTTSGPLDLNDLDPGLRRCGPSIENSPSSTVSANGSFVLTMRVDTANILQLMFHREFFAIFFRQKYKGTWRDWKEVAFK